MAFWDDAVGARQGWRYEAGTDVLEWREATELDPNIADAGGRPGDGGITVADGVGV